MKKLTQPISLLFVGLLWTANSFADDTDASATDQEAAGALEEVTVTAQRRSENLQDVPISITSLTADLMEKMALRSSESLTEGIPALQFARQTGNGATPYIRGVGAIQASAGNEMPVAVYVDDVYIGSPAANIFQFNNIASVDVLKGPQGTLFGRNATGGVVMVRTKQPTQTPEFDATLGYGSYQTTYGKLYASGPLSDTVAGNIALVGHDQEEGYGNNLITGEDTLKGWNYGIRGELVWDPTERTNLWFGGDYGRSNSDFGMDVVIVPGTVGTGGGTFQNPFGTYDVPNDSAPNENYGAAFKLTHEFDSVTLKAISAYRYNSYCLNLNVTASTTGQIQLVIGCVVPPGFSLPQGVKLHPSEVRTFSQEVQLLSNTAGPLSWILGGYFYTSETETGRTGTFGTFVGGVRYGTNPAYLDLDSYAGYADGTYQLTDKARLSAGVRYTTDKFERRGATVVPDSASLSKSTYRAVLDYSFKPDIMGYVSYSTGYHTGGLAAPITLTDGSIYTPPPIQPETLKATEIGAKTELLDNRLRLNASAFHYEYTNLQVAQVLAGNAQILNAGEAKMDGGEVDWQLAASSRLVIGGGIALLDSRFTDFPGGPINVQRPGTCNPPVSTGPPTGGALSCTTDLTGNDTPHSPPFTLNLNATYTVPLANGSSLAATATYYYNGGFYWEPDNLFKEESYNVLNMTVGWTSSDGVWEVRAIGRNLTDEYYNVYLSTSTLRAAGSPAMPRNYMVEFSYHR